MFNEFKKIIPVPIDLQESEEMGNESEAGSVPPDPAAGALTETAEETAPPARTLVCRAGPGLLVTVYGNQVLLVIEKRPARPATAGLAPGECAWEDGGLTENEPRELYHVDAEFGMAIGVATFDGKSSDWGIMALEYKWVEDLRDANYQVALDVNWPASGRRRWVASNGRRLTPPYPML